MTWATGACWLVGFRCGLISTLLWEGQCPKLYPDIHQCLCGPSFTHMFNTCHPTRMLNRIHINNIMLDPENTWFVFLPAVCPTLKFRVKCHGWMDGWMALEVLLHQQVKQFPFLSSISVKSTHKWEIGLLCKCVQHWQLVSGLWCPHTELHSREQGLTISFSLGECWLIVYRWMLGWRFHIDVILYMDLSSCMDGLNT